MSVLNILLWARKVCFWCKIYWFDYWLLLLNMFLNILLWNHSKTIRQFCFWIEMYCFASCFWTFCNEIIEKQYDNVVFALKCIDLLNDFIHFVMKSLKNNGTSLFLKWNVLNCLIFLTVLLWNQWKTIGRFCFWIKMYWFAKCFWTFCYEIIVKQ